MGRIIAIANQKGGVGKTTTSINLSACLAEAGKKVLVVDIDPQGNATSGLGVEKNELENTIYELFVGECELSDCLIENVLDNLSVLPSNVNLSGAEIDLIGIEKRERPWQSGDSTPSTLLPHWKHSRAQDDAYSEWKMFVN